MARLNTKRIEKKAFPLNQHQVEILYHGCRLMADECEPGFVDLMGQRVAWCRYKRELMRGYMASRTNYATRPAAFWTFEAGQYIPSATGRILYLLNNGHLRPAEKQQAFKILALNKVDPAMIENADLREQYAAHAAILADE